MSKTTLIYIALLLVLCAGSFWLGTRQSEVVESVETVVKIDTVYIDTPAPPVNVQPSEPKIVYLTEYKTERDTVTITNTIRDSVKVYVPISDYTFEQDSLYRIQARGYDVRLTSVELYNRTTTTTNTLRTPIKHWSVNAGMTTLTTQGLTDLYLGANIGYSSGGWTFKGGYNFALDGNGIVMFSVERRIFNF